MDPQCRVPPCGRRRNGVRAWSGAAFAKRTGSARHPIRTTRTPFAPVDVPARDGFAGCAISQIARNMVNGKDADMTNRSGHRPPTARHDEAPVKRQRIWLYATMTFTTRALIASSTLAAIIALPATAHADFNYRRFQSPSGDILCVMLRNHDINDPANYGKGAGTCQVQDPTYAVPPRQYVAAADGQLGFCFLSEWGSQFSLLQGSPPHLDCVGNALLLPPLPTLDYGQAMSLGAITCASEPSAMTCTDTSSGRFFRVSRDSYQLG
jgi:uncharacterized protein DUF6636